ncbi:hypothetical protein [Pseudoalteromonas gelatinilytica]
MLILLKINSGFIAPQLPDDVAAFLRQEVVVIDGQQYLYANYIGAKDIESDYNVDDYITNLVADEPKLIPVIIEKVEGLLDGYVNAENEYTVPQSSDAVIATGRLSIPDRKFKVPFLRLDTGREQLMPAEVIDGVFTLPLKFETNGTWVVNQALINKEYEQDIFSIEERRFSVL